MENQVRNQFADSAKFSKTFNRLTLNYKGIPFVTKWVEFPDIQAKCAEMGIPPGITKRDGTHIYTVPAIWDPSTETGVSNSLRIARYLDKTYPKAPPVCFDGIEEYDNIMSAYKMPELRHMDRFLVPLIYDKVLNPRSQEYFRRTREKLFRRTIEEMEPLGEERVSLLNEIRKGFHNVDRWLLRNGGPFAHGDEVSFVDFAWGGYMIWLRQVFGENSELWQDIMTWDEDRWGKYMDNLRKYEKPVDDDKSL